VLKDIFWISSGIFFSKFFQVFFNFFAVVNDSAVANLEAFEPILVSNRVT
jgi:hypothetical protein